MVAYLEKFKILFKRPYLKGNFIFDWQHNIKISKFLESICFVLYMKRKKKGI